MTIIKEIKSRYRLSLGERVSLPRPKYMSHDHYEQMQRLYAARNGDPSAINELNSINGMIWSQSMIDAANMLLENIPPSLKGCFRVNIGDGQTLSLKPFFNYEAKPAKILWGIYIDDEYWLARCQFLDSGGVVDWVVRYDQTLEEYIPVVDVTFLIVQRKEE